MKLRIVNLNGNGRGCSFIDLVVRIGGFYEKNIFPSEYVLERGVRQVEFGFPSKSVIIQVYITPIKFL